MDTVWRIRAVTGEGWVRSFLNDQPQITASQAAAHQFDDQAEAVACVERWNRRKGYVPVKVVEGERTERYQHGAPS